MQCFNRYASTFHLPKFLTQILPELKATHKPKKRFSQIHESSSFLKVLINYEVCEKTRVLDLTVSTFHTVILEQN